MLTPNEKEELNRLVNGFWADCDVICKLLHITFGTGLKIFDYSRTNDKCKFKIKAVPKDVFTKTQM